MCFNINREDNMSYSFNSIVNRNEAEALKEMIFSRARERSVNMNEEVQQDIMDIARDSFVSKNNPFSKIIENAPAASNTDKPEVSKKEEIGFPMREIKSRVSTQSRLINEQIAEGEIKNNMLSAREALSQKQSFMGALNFLNSQAAISLIRTRADKFEILA